MRRGRRADPRAELVLPATLDAVIGRGRISLLDISSFGACLEGLNLPSTGREVILKCGNIDAFGTVAWSAGRRCGVQFDKPVGPAALIALRRIAPNVGEHAQTPEELHAVADWMNGLTR